MIVLTAATEGDLDRVVGIERACFSDPWSRASFQSSLDAPHVVFACARESDTLAIVGYVVATFAADEGEILNLAVDPSARARGIGARLLDTVIAEARRRRTATIYLDVRMSNVAARSLYASRGFIEAGLRRNYYEMPDEDAIVLSLTTSAMKCADVQ